MVEKAKIENQERICETTDINFLIIYFLAELNPKIEMVEER